MKNNYQIIYADPPWSYKDKAAAGKRGAEFKYQCMKPEEIKALPIDQIAAENTTLFMWVTMPMLPVGLDVMKAWGFQYKTVAFTWVKRTKKSNNWFFGMGNWTRANAELCLLGIKGKPKRVNAGVSSLIDSPIQGHSKKPDVTRDCIVKLMGEIPRIELFARQSTPGWDVIGSEIDGKDIQFHLDRHISMLELNDLIPEDDLPI